MSVNPPPRPRAPSPGPRAPVAPCRRGSPAPRPVPAPAAGDGGRGQGTRGPAPDTPAPDDRPPDPQGPPRGGGARIYILAARHFLPVSRPDIGGVQGRILGGYLADVGRSFGRIVSAPKPVPVCGPTRAYAVSGELVGAPPTVSWGLGWGRWLGVWAGGRNRCWVRQLGTGFVLCVSCVPCPKPWGVFAPH